MARVLLLYIYMMINVFILVEKAKSTTEYDTYFHIFSLKNPTKPISLLWTDDSRWSKEKSLETCSIKIIAHGYAERWNMDWRWDWVADLKNEILNRTTNENYCVVAVDWERGAREVNFITAVANADIAGEHLATFLQNNNIDPKRLHCIGFSLGAHLCAFASNSYHIQTKQKSKFARITGLDPSGPLLRKASIDKRLSPDDADFVDCIHTSKTFGLQEKSGHMDFFPDGGDSNAKSCEKLLDIRDNDDETADKRERIRRFLFGSKDSTENENGDLPKKNLLERLRDRIGRVGVLKKVFLNVHAYIGCNHLRSPHYFIASIHNCQFRAKLCSSWSNYLANKCNDPIDNELTYPRMGFRADRSDIAYQRGNGSFYLKTIATKPYCSDALVSSKQKSKKQLTKKSKSKIKKISDLSRSFFDSIDN